jgi:hypothetical protein
MYRQIDGHTNGHTDKQTQTQRQKERWSPIMTREQKYGQYEQYGQYGQKVLFHKIHLLTSLYIKM